MVLVLVLILCGNQIGRAASIPVFGIDVDIDVSVDLGCGGGGGVGVGADTMWQPNWEGC